MRSKTLILQHNSVYTVIFRSLSLKQQELCAGLPGTVLHPGTYTSAESTELTLELNKVSITQKKCENYTLASLAAPPGVRKHEVLQHKITVKTLNIG